MADLGLADAVDAAEALLDAVRVPRQVVVDQQVRALEVDALAGGVGRDEDDAVLVLGEDAPGLRRRSSRRTPPWIATTASVAPEEGAKLVDEVVERVAVLGEDDQLASAAVGSNISGASSSRLDELRPLAVAARNARTRVGERFEPRERRDLDLQLGDRARGGRLVDELAPRGPRARRRRGRRGRRDRRRRRARRALDSANSAPRRACALLGEPVLRAARGGGASDW